MKSFFVIDVESIGLHGEAFAVAGGLYLENGACQWEFSYCCGRNNAMGSIGSRKWVDENIPLIEITHPNRLQMMNAFWEMWLKARKYGALMAADCPWPAEAKFLEECVSINIEEREYEAPYPLIDINSIIYNITGSGNPDFFFFLLVYQESFPFIIHWLIHVSLPVCFAAIYQSYND